MNARPPHKSGGTNAEKSDNKDLYQIDPETVVCVTRPWLNDAVYHETEIEDGTRVPKCSTFPPERGEYHEARVFIERGQGYLDLCGNCEVAVDGNPVSKKEFQERPCPLCGEGVKMLARHIPTCPERDSASAESDDQLVTDGGLPSPGDYRVPTIDELDAMRVDRGLSQKELSRRAGMEPGRFNHILHHDVDPHASTVRSFLRVLREAVQSEQRDLSNKRGPKPKPSTLADPPESLEDIRTDGGVATHPYAPEDLGTATVEYGGCSHDQVGMRFAVPNPAIRALDAPRRVSVCFVEGDWMLLSGVVDSGWDYAVTDDRGFNCRISTRACEAMDLSVGDRVRHHEADEGIRLEVIQVEADGGVESDIEIVGAYSQHSVDRCENWLGQTPGSRCQQEATHTLVLAGPGGMTNLAMCDDCGRPDDAGERYPVSTGRDAALTDGGDR